MKRWAAVGLLCGWVLWSGVTEEGTSRSNDWRIEGAFESGADCDQKAESSRDDFWKSTGGKGQRGALAGVAGGMVFMPDPTRRGKGAVTWYLCLPGGTDPRPRYKE